MQSAPLNEVKYVSSYIILRKPQFPLSFDITYILRNVNGKRKVVPIFHGLLRKPEIYNELFSKLPILGTAICSDH